MSCARDLRALPARLRHQGEEARRETRTRRPPLNRLPRPDQECSVVHLVGVKVNVTRDAPKTLCDLTATLGLPELIMAILAT